jgi:hypothetical protein
VTIAPSKHTTASRRSAVIRLTLGVAQMSAAAFALGLLAVEGVTARALAAAVTACTITTLSVLLFGRRSPAE